MTTTPVFVELLAIGFGALAGVFLAVSGCFGYNPLDTNHGLFELADPIVWLIPTLTLAYVFGIVTDRLADRLFSDSDKEDLCRTFREDPDHDQDRDRERCRERYYHLRRTLALHGSFLWANLEYGRSRMRICRGWALNSVFLGLGLSLFLLGCASSFSLSGPRLLIYIAVVVVGSTALGVLCRKCCLELNRSEYNKIKRQAKWLEDRLNGKGLEREKE